MTLPTIRASSALAGVRYEIRGQLAHRAHEMERLGYGTLWYGESLAREAFSQGAIYLARSPHASGGRPGTWQKWTGKGWGAPGVQNVAEPVLKAPAKPPFLTMQMPHVSWNTALHRWLMVFASNVAFHAAASEDGIHFGPPIEITRLPAFHMKPGEIFTAYPTLLSPDKATQMVTG